MTKSASCTVVAPVTILALITAVGLGAAQPPPNFTVAFIGDQSVEPEARLVAELVMSEGAHAVVHSGDFDYLDDPAAWEDSLNAWFGSDFPYFASIGNHDKLRFRGPGGYQEFLEARLIRLGIDWDGDLAVNSSLTYEGIEFVLTGPDVEGSGHDLYIRAALATSPAIWRVSSWHRNMRLMQVGGKDDDTGWGVYEESRRGGAIIATAHSHTYSRSRLLSNIANQTIADTSDTLTIRLDDPTTTLDDEGASFVFVSGLGGRSIRDQEIGGPWWASVYTSTQGADYGALFGVFHVEGDPRLAHFYFKSIDSVIVDEFWVRTDVDPPTSAVGPALHTPEVNSVALVSGNPVTGDLALEYSLSRPMAVRISVHDVRGRLLHSEATGHAQAAGAHRWTWVREPAGRSVPPGVYFVRISTPNASRSVRAVLLGGYGGP